MIQDAIEVRLKPRQRDELEARLRAGTTQQRDVLRLKIVLHAAEGSSTREIARVAVPNAVALYVSESWPNEPEERRPAASILAERTGGRSERVAFFSERTEPKESRTGARHFGE